jgi:hypothetical protein
MHTQEELLRYFAAYLPYNVMVHEPNVKIINTFILDCEALNYMESHGFENFKLILKPLSDYDNVNSESMIELNTDISVEIMLVDIVSQREYFGNCPYNIMELCFRNHIDIFSLIPKGIAVSIRDFQTLNQ